tara:strand:- start:9563 stop:10018 length:456 start_codon:yes stop_codon:yes gene_type:complete
MYYIFYIVVLFIIIDLLFSLYRLYRRTTTYNKAFKKSKETNKELLVIGNPTAGFINRNIYKSYDCGDLCLDLNGCDSCPNQIKGDLLEEIKKLESNKYVVFESCVLEYIPESDLFEVRTELYRISGGDLYEVRIYPNIMPLDTNIKFIELG